MSRRCTCEICRYGDPDDCRFYRKHRRKERIAVVDVDANLNNRRVGWRDPVTGDITLDAGTDAAPVSD